MIVKIARAGILAFILAASTADIAAARTAYAAARTAYDGAWSLTFVTQRGACDPTYHFGIQIANGMISHPNLVKFRGRVSSGGRVRASVSVPGKHASGSGRLSRT